MYDSWPRPVEGRPRKRRTYKGRDKVTGRADGKRTCPAFEGLISATTCRDSRGRVNGCDARCPYYAPLVLASDTPAASRLPLHKCYLRRLPRSGSATVLVARANPDATLRVVLLLLDFWKVGIQECFVDASTTEDALAKLLRKEGPEFEEVELSECQALVKWAETISREVGHEIPWEYTHWNAILDDMGQVAPPTGSLYKCARCSDELPDKAVDLMKRYALDAQVQFYLVCRKCGGEFDDDW
ncbi:hypothetical protein HN371_09440 [Candidatus Poribacteria bacterium]|jgi:hypothetical protein|nr:hypothetical protein [Candidatus Poribacteria bacterium]MBT5535786.1 hypothetical protein [Candidatus Poribacteria bacterium]MBT5715229.1 hypothetical protein [Candidatus Poribacteria bacterium]MBT7096879.1 hypothetical protein [Candidatus Poribacteria bacterium]MBT7805228.1 hypothetical protein [Candidatus Poribacteria bacterium]